MIRFASNSLGDKQPIDFGNVRVGSRAHTLTLDITPSSRARGRWDGVVDWKIKPRRENGTETPQGHGVFLTSNPLSARGVIIGGSSSAVKVKVAFKPDTVGEFDGLLRLRYRHISSGFSSEFVVYVMGTGIE